MKQKRTVNRDKLKMLVWEKGVKQTALKAQVGLSTLDKLINNRDEYKDRIPGEEFQKKLVKALKVKHDDLFPLKDSRAS